MLIQSNFIYSSYLCQDNMKICIFLLLLTSTILTARQMPTCNCPEMPPICASNGMTYAGICRMFCHHLYLHQHLHKIYDGPCDDRLFGYDYILSEDFKNIGI